jgi:hypothetical protein
MTTGRLGKMCRIWVMITMTTGRLGNMCRHLGHDHYDNRKVGKDVPSSGSGALRLQGV